MLYPLSYGGVAGDAANYSPRLALGPARPDPAVAIITANHAFHTKMDCNPGRDRSDGRDCAGLCRLFVAQHGLVPGRYQVMHLKAVPGPVRPLAA